MKSDLRINWLIAIGLAGWLIYLLAPILTPFVAAALLAYVGDPLADRLQKLKMPRTLAVVVVFLVTFLTLGLLVLLIVPLIRNQVGALLDALPAIGAQVEQVWLPWVAQFLDIDLGEYLIAAVYEALRNGEYYPWDYQPLRDASERYMRNHLDLNDLEENARFPRGE